MKSHPASVASRSTPLHAPSSGGVRLGDVVAGKYRVERLLGRGGMGIVVAARHVHLGEPVAIKLLLPGSPITPRAFARFVREGRAAARMRGEHVARVHDVGVLASGEPYLVLEYLRGIDLRTVIKKRGPLPVDTAVAYLLQVCEAVAEAHSLGIVHRDLKPANLFLTRRADGPLAVKVIDFGVSKFTAESEEQGSAASLTAHDGAIGTPGYMAPEQMRSARTADARADIWSLGAVLYGLLTGSSPFAGDTMIEVYDGILKGSPPLRVARADAPLELEEIVSRCLRIDPAERYQDVGQLAAALGAVLPPSARADAERALSFEDLELARDEPPDSSRTKRGLATTEPGPALAGNSFGEPPGERAATASSRDASWARGRQAGEPHQPVSEQRTTSLRRRRLAGALGMAFIVSCAAGAIVFWPRPSSSPPSAPVSTPPPPTASAPGPATTVDAASAPGPATTIDAAPESTASPPLPPSRSAAASRRPSAAQALSAPPPTLSAPPPTLSAAPTAPSATSSAPARARSLPGMSPTPD